MNLYGGKNCNFISTYLIFVVFYFVLLKTLFLESVYGLRLRSVTQKGLRESAFWGVKKTLGSGRKQNHLGVN